MKELLKACKKANKIIEKSIETSDENIFYNMAEVNTILWQAIKKTED